ncbi:MAG: LemA family protein [Candidatus Wildermuthbacteria bacterium]|nr:LemA family protein [Candidatus Wildermuthbacteria bacterium]
MTDMSKKTIVLLAIGGVILFSLLWGVGTYNRFVSLNEGIDAQWAQVEVQLQRRFDLIPNLVESVKGIFEQEQNIFLAISEARTRYAGARTVDEKAEAASQLQGALARLLVVVENYPQLRSTETVSRLMDELAGTENRVAVERRRFNEQVRDYNIAIKRFPGKLLASLFGYEGRELFEAAEGADQVPQVDF